jgi:pyruvate dehydrogenase kinase 2/3/4
VKFDVNPALHRSRPHQEVSSSTPAMTSSFRITSALWDKIHHFASFPQTGGEFRWPLGAVPWLTVTATTLLVSLQQMVQFGQNPSQGTLLRASQFLLGKFEVLT